MARKSKGGSSLTVKKGSETKIEKKRSPAGRGGVAMGRTVGLPFGGARARKRKSSDQRGSKTK